LKARKVYVYDLQVGMELAEPVLTDTGNVLLHAGQKLSERHLEAFAVWDIPYAIIFEPVVSDTSKLDADASVPLIVQFKQMASAESAMSVMDPQRNKYCDITDYVREHRHVPMDSFKELSGSLLQAALNDPSAAIICATRPDSVWPAIINHSIMVTLLALKIASLCERPVKEMLILTMAALLHDIGKLDLPENFSPYERDLDVTDESVYREHVKNGIMLILSTEVMPGGVTVAIAQHHEAEDGTGFPLGIKGDKIALNSKIIAVADFFCNTFHGKNRCNGDILRAIQQLKAAMYNSLDASVVVPFISYLERFLAGRIVTLSNGHLAEIVWNHQTRSRPVVRCDDNRVIDLEKDRSIHITGMA